MSLKVLTPKYFRSDHNSTRGPKFSENNGPADQFSRNFGPPDQNFWRTKISVTSLPFPQEAWQGDKILTYLLIKVSNEVTYLHEIGPFRAILTRGIQQQGPFCEITATLQVMHEF